MNNPITGPKTYRRHDTAAERLPENVRRRLERELTGLVTVIDDSGELEETLKGVLPEGWKMKSFSAPFQALTSLSADAPIAVVTRVDNQGFDGLGLLREVASSNPEVRRILVTERTGASQMLTAVNEIGVHRVLERPLNRAQVEEAPVSYTHLTLPTIYSV